MPTPMAWPRLLTSARLGRADAGGKTGHTSFERDFDRVLFSRPFRRLQDKTQVFPMPANDHVHNRMTHSLEVASVGRSLGKRAGYDVIRRHGLDGFHAADLGDIVAAACLMHDLGNPPFGHAGEDAIGAWFRDADAAGLLADLAPQERLDLCHFEGNAQTLRIVARLENHPGQGGMQLTCATLAAVAKYPQPSTERRTRPGVAHKKFNYFGAEGALFAEVAEAVGLVAVAPGVWRRHPLAWLVEAADDLCFHILDAEDGYLLGLFGFEEIEALFVPLAGAVAPMRDERAAVGWLRAKAIGKLVDECVDAFAAHEERLLGEGLDKPLAAMIPSSDALRRVGERSRERCYRAPEVLRVELAGYRVLGELLGLFVPAALATRPDTRQEKVLALLPAAVRAAGTPYERLLAATDYVAGMTDGFAVRTWRELTGVALPEIVGRHRGRMDDSA
ncbi:MAG: dGTP triphosphohydrolase [Myxococcota bacterium]